MLSEINNQEDLWKLYCETREPSIREKLIIRYSHLVKYVAGRLNMYFGSNVEYDDLVSYGVFGLIDAIDKYDVGKGVKFETYASLRIRGAIIDSIRELDWVPRSLRQKNKDLEKLYTEMEEKLGYPPSDSEMAGRLGISVDEYQKMLSDISISSMSSLEELLEQNNDIGIENNRTSREEKPEDHLEMEEMKDVLAKAIDELPEKEKLVVSLYYYEELTLKEISAIMKVSESRISQLHTKAVLRLHGKIIRYNVT